LYLARRTILKDLGMDEKAILTRASKKAIGRKSRRKETTRKTET
jgi:hypothetical protein